MAGPGGFLGKVARGVGLPIPTVNGPNVPQISSTLNGLAKRLEGHAEYVIDMKKGKGPENLFRVDEKDGKFSAKPVTRADLLPEDAAKIKTPAQLQSERKLEDSPVKIAADLKYANSTDAYIAEKLGRAPDAPVTAGATPEQTREAVIASLQGDLKDIKKIPNASMSKDERDQFKSTVEGEIGRLRNINGIDDALQVANIAAQPAPAAPAAPATSFPKPGQ